VGLWFSSLKPACNSFVSDERVVWISLEGLPLKVWTRNTFAKVASKWGDLVEWEDLAEKSLFCKRLYVKTKLNEIIAKRFKVIMKGSVYWVRVQEIKAQDLFICNDSYESDSSDDEENEKDDGSQSGDKVSTDNDVEMVFESSCMHNNDLLYDNNHNNIMPETKIESMELVTIKTLWGNSSFDYALSYSLGNSEASLINLPPDGYAYTWAYKTSNKMNGFEKILEDTWKSLATVDSNGMISLKKKLQALKIVIQQWTKNAKKSSYKAKIPC
nr:RNA-directed DNA polymerase, eukaryota, nucleotide-binding alpha-beta plait domain protein [Tanacetum cinerariifolium]